MKPPISYYGGKQRMASKIVPLLPRHTVYVEPFAGGAAVLFAKPWPQVTSSRHYREVINDSCGDLVNFYRVLRDRPDKLVRAIGLTPCSRTEHTKIAREASADEIESARRYFVDTQQSFGKKRRGGWSVGVFGPNQTATWAAKTAALHEHAARMLGIYIENDDALAVIKRWDSPQTLFYCDPPYPGADQGHYAGYSQDDFSALCDTLDACEGAFVLSCYDNPAARPEWERFEFSATATASREGRAGKGRNKSRKATQAELGNTKRTEVVWRRQRKGELRRELVPLFADDGPLACFENKQATTVAEVM